MRLVTRTLRYADYSATAVATLCTLGTLYLWAEAIMWWGDAMAMASALTWTVLTLLVWTVAMGMGYLYDAGE